MTAHLVIGRLLTGALLLIGLTGAALAQERVLSFDSRITIARDGSMTVEEAVRVRAEGQAIRRGIFRDFPTRYRDRFGNRVVVDFEVLGVSRSGNPEPWFTERRSNGVRLYVGDENTFLASGEYTYTFRYKTNRQLGFFADHDELYWNVTGNGWQFAIDAVSARVFLPDDRVASDLSIEGYTGFTGDAGQDYTAAVFDGGGSIRTTRPLSPEEGLTLVFSWPKGVVEQPTLGQRLGYLLGDNLGLLLALVTFVAIVGYLTVMWSRYGRDPEPGVIFPHYQPPPGYSPASARYISRMGYDSRVLSAAVINLAVKGHLRIIDQHDYCLEKSSSDVPLAGGENQLLMALFAEGSRVELDNKNHALIDAARSTHQQALKKDYLGLYFKKNTWLILPCLLLLVVMLVGVAIFAYISVAVVVLAVCSALAIALFTWLLRAPTPRGRLLLDKLQGFKQYLEVAEKDDLNLKHPPDLTPELFERYLPFAIALGVEQPWSERFAAVFANLEAGGGDAYRPQWFQGSYSPGNLAGFSRDLGNGFTSAMSAAATPSGSSSGAGGGGFSGGGGGGGGGGGW